MRKHFCKNGIKCPHCGFEDKDWETLGFHTSVGGEEAKEDECGRCGKPFVVKEVVIRTWCIFESWDHFQKDRYGN